MSVSNGKITAPVSISDIASCIGDSTDICKSPNINMWSKRKPVRSSSRTRLSDDAMAKLNFGFAISVTDDVTSDDTVYEADPDKALTKAINSGGSWKYLQPRGSAYDEHSRILDFDGYNHYAEPPYVVTLQATSTNQNTIWADIEESENCEIPVESLQGTVFADDLSTYCPALLYRKSGQTSGVQILIDDAQIGESLANGSRVVFYPTFGEAGTYDMVFAATNADPAAPYEDDNAWVFLPETYRQVVYNPDSGVLDVTLYLDEDDGFVVNMYDDEVNTVELRFYVRQVEMPYAPEAVIYVELSDADGEVQATASIETGEIDSDAYVLSKALTVTNPRTDVLTKDEVYIRAWYQYREFDTNDAYETRYINLETNRSSESYVAPVTVQSVINSL